MITRCRSGYACPIMKKKYPVILSDTERDDLKRLIAMGTAPARKLTHARILLKADESAEGPGLVDEKVADAVEVSQPTVARVRRQYFEEGVEAALNRSPPKREYHRKLDGEQEARLSSLWPAHSRPRDKLAGACGCWQIGWWSLRSWRTSPTRRSGGLSKKLGWQSLLEQLLFEPGEVGFGVSPEA